MEMFLARMSLILVVNQLDVTLLSSTSQKDTAAKPVQNVRKQIFDHINMYIAS